MAIVHKARDPVEDRDVAIKRILWPHGVDAERWGDFHERFHRKAAEAERLSHPGIVSVYEVEDNSEDGTPFIAMEYVPGPTLHELIRTEGALNPGWALSVADTLADALQSAHDAGVVHPDFKPANAKMTWVDILLSTEKKKLLLARRNLLIILSIPGKPWLSGFLLVRVC